MKAREAKEQATYLIPKAIKKKVRVAAAESGVWPADYVAKVLKAHFDRIDAAKPATSLN